MQFAYLPRKLSHPASYSSKTTRLSPALRRSRAQLVFALIAFVGLFLYLRSGGETVATTTVPAGTPPVVVVTVISPERNAEWSEKIRQNRRQYAELRGYGTFFPVYTDYDLNKAPKTWARVPAMRHAMTMNPHSTFFLYVDENAIITNYDIDISRDLMAKEKLEGLMQGNIPVVPPDSVIKTFAHLKGDRVNIVLSQDREGLAHNSFILRNGDWAKYFLDAWFDPLYRAYNFQKAEAHALEHLVQWHGTILSKLALIPQNHINSYADALRDKASNAGRARDGDFVTSFGICDVEGRNCPEEMQRYFDSSNKQYDDMKK